MNLGLRTWKGSFLMNNITHVERASIAASWTPLSSRMGPWPSISENYTGHTVHAKKYSKTYKVFSDQREIDFLVMLSHIHKIQRGCRELFWERPWQSWPYLCTEGPATFRVHTDGSTPGISNKHGHVEHRILDLPLYRRPPGSPWSDEKWDVTRVLEFPGYSRIYAQKHLQNL